MGRVCRVQGRIREHNHNRRGMLLSHLDLLYLDPVD